MKTEPSYRVKNSTRGRVVPLCLGSAPGICPGRVARQTIPAPLRKKFGIKGGFTVAGCCQPSVCPRFSRAIHRETEAEKVVFEVIPSGAFLLKPVAANGR